MIHKSISDRKEKKGVLQRNILNCLQEFVGRREIWIALHKRLRARQNQGAVGIGEIKHNQRVF